MTGNPSSFSPSSAGKRAVCTIASCNYWAYVRVFARTLTRYEPETELYVLLVDRPKKEIRPEEESFKVIYLEELDNIPEVPHFFFKYDALELNTAVKPYFLEYLFARYELEKIIFCDPDIAFFDHLGEVWDLLGKHSIILTPHITKPFDDSAWPTELHINQSGIFNLGFLALASSGSTPAFLKWWQQKLFDGCYMQIEKGMHVDQKWANYIPALYEDSLILRSSRYNIAYWNLHYTGEALSFINEELFLADRKAVFFHFSGFDPRDIESISRHQNRYRLSSFAGLRPLFEYYRERLFAAGYEDYKKLPYAFGFFDNGFKISLPMKSLFRRIGGSFGLFPNPFDSSDAKGFWRYALSPCEGSGTGKPAVSRILYVVYEMRPDLQAVFPRPLGRDRKAFVEWGKVSGLKDYGHPLVDESGEKKFSRFRHILTDLNYILRRAAYHLVRRAASFRNRILGKYFFLEALPSRRLSFGVNVFFNRALEQSGGPVKIMEVLRESSVPCGLVGGSPAGPVLSGCRYSFNLIPSDQELLPEIAAKNRYQRGVYNIYLMNEIKSLRKKDCGAIDEIWISEQEIYQSAAPSAPKPVFYMPEFSNASAASLFGGSNAAVDRLSYLYEHNQRLRSGSAHKLYLRFLAAADFAGRLFHLAGRPFYFIKTLFSLSRALLEIKRSRRKKGVTAFARIEHMGDIIACEPALRQAAEKHPDNELILFTRPPYRPLLQRHPAAAHIISVDCLTIWNWISKLPFFDEIYDLHFDGIWCLGCRLRLKKKRSFSAVNMYNYYSMGNLLKVFSLTAGLEYSDIRPRFYMDPAALGWADEMQLPKRFAVIHRQSTDRMREWDESKWAELSRLLAAEENLPVVDIGLRDKKAGSIEGVMDLRGRLALMQTAEVIRRAAVFIGIDSGPAHMANALETPSVIILGRFQNFIRYTPYSGRAESPGRRILVQSSGPAATASVSSVYAAAKDVLADRAVPAGSLNYVR